MLKVAFFLVAIFSCQNVLAQQGMGPLNINLIGSSKCEGDDGNFLSIDVVSIDEDNKGLTTDFNIDFPLDESISYKVRVDKIENGEIQEGVFNHEGNNACMDFEKYFGKLWDNIGAVSGMAKGCPIDPGHYHAADIPFHDEDLELKSFLYGHFLLNFEAERNGDKILCQIVEFTNSRPGESV